jgi:hypothetical protein
LVQAVRRGPDQRGRTTARMPARPPVSGGCKVRPASARCSFVSPSEPHDAADVPTFDIKVARVPIHQVVDGD